MTRWFRGSRGICCSRPQINQNFLTVSDHGHDGSNPRQIKACDKINDKFGKDTLSPIFAAELSY
jgi:hypothetical protein